MAPRAKPRTLEHETPPPLTPDDVFFPPAHSGLPPVEDDDDVASLSAVLAELGESEAGGFVNVYREKALPSGRRKEEYIDRFNVIEFSLETLKSKWGAGDYKIMVYRAGGNGLATRKTISIAADPFNVPASAPVTLPAAVDLSPVIAAIKEGNDKTLQGILSIAQAMQNNQPKAPSMLEMLQQMQLMKEITGGSQQNYNPIDLLKLGVEMASNGGGESNNAWVGKMIDQFGPLMTKLIPETPPRRTGPPVTPAAMKPAQVASPAPMLETPALVETPASVNVEDNSMNTLIVAYLQFLKHAAAKKASVEDHADRLLSNLSSDEDVRQLEEMLKPDNWRQIIAQHTPIIEQHPEWFTELRNTLLLYIEEDRQVAIAETPQSSVLTTGKESGSVPGHENDNPALPGTDKGSPEQPA